jgi:stage V sporulation protein G
MEITEVRIKLMDDPHERLQAFCSLTFDACFVIRDLKIIAGAKGSFVAMPSRKLTDRCPRCGNKNHLRCRYCNQCGAKLDEDRAVRADDGRAKLYADIAHPINSACREMIQERVVVAYHEELERARQPGYVCTYDDYGEEAFAALDESEVDTVVVPRSAPAPHSVPARSDLLPSRPETTRRADAAAAGPSGPHHGLGGPRGDYAALVPRTTTASVERDETFGDGLV